MKQRPNLSALSAIIPNGNAFKDVSTGTGLGSMEPGQVWVSENGSTWYALAGSEHYEPSTIWNYSVTYTKTETGGTDWKDNYGNTMASTHGRSFAWPSPDVYTMNDLPKQSSFTLTGILLPCVDGTITGTDNFNFHVLCGLCLTGFLGGAFCCCRFLIRFR